MNISEKVDQFLEKNFVGNERTVYKDLSLNLKKVLEDSPLTEQERFLGLLTIATSLHHNEAAEFAAVVLQKLGVSSEQIQEAKDNAAIMGMLNTYYKFKGMLSPESAPDYTRAGLRMNSLAKPVLGKETFEMLSLAVSVVNACPTCISSHEKALRQLNVSADKIHDLARLASVMKGLTTLAQAA